MLTAPSSVFELDMGVTEVLRNSVGRRGREIF